MSDGCSFSLTQKIGQWKMMFIDSQCGSKRCSNLVPNLVLASIAQTAPGLPNKNNCQQHGNCFGSQIQSICLSVPSQLEQKDIGLHVVRASLLLLQLPISQGSSGVHCVSVHYQLAKSARRMIIKAAECAA